MTANEHGRRAAPPRVPPPAAAGWPDQRPGPVLVLSGTVGPGGPEALCRQVTVLLAQCQGGRVICDVGKLGGPGMAVVDTLARVTLAAGRLGVAIQFRGLRPELLELLVFTGLDTVLPVLTPPGPAQ